MPRGMKVTEIADEDVGSALGVQGFDITMTTDAATMAGGTGKKQKYATLWQQVGRPQDKMFRPSTINTAAVEKKCRLRDEKTGRPMWYREIPRGGRAESVDPKYKCPVCNGTFGEIVVESSNGAVTPGALQLDDHMRRAHSAAAYARWKPMLDKLLASMVADPTSLFVDAEDEDVELVRRAKPPIEPARLEI